MTLRNLFGCATCGDAVRGLILQAADDWAGAAAGRPLVVDVDGTLVPHPAAARFAHLGPMAAVDTPPPERPVVDIVTSDGHLAVAGLVVAGAAGQAWRVSRRRPVAICDGPQPPVGTICGGCLDTAVTAIRSRRVTIAAGRYTAAPDALDDTTLMVLLTQATAAAPRRR